MRMVVRVIEHYFVRICWQGMVSGPVVEDFRSWGGIAGQEWLSQPCQGSRIVGIPIVGGDERVRVGSGGYAVALHVTSW